ncbi:MAG: AAA family ATPase [Deltaproteobacteria bacterium]|nr:AAA family ATPase [Deltaproteobacteria bacterium]
MSQLSGCRCAERLKKNRRPPIPKGGLKVEDGNDPLTLIRRQNNSPGFFVTAYGTHRPLPSPAHVPAQLTAFDRLRPLFADTPKLTSVAFYRMFAETDPERAEVFRQAVNSVLHPPGGKPLLPGLSELRYNPPRRNELMERQTVRQKMGEGFVDIPTLTLALGHQSTLAWIADLIGHAMLADDNITTTQQITGIALVDEIDLYVHPSLQVSLIRNLMRAFPRVQFIVTTHSPLVLAALRPDQDEIVRLEIDPETGLVVRRDMKQGQPHEPDARVMSMAGVYKHYFGVESAYAGPEGAMLYRHQALANDPTRSDAEDAELQDLRAKLTEAGVGGLLEPIARDPS